jgi:hypothetical protein
MFTKNAMELPKFLKNSLTMKYGFKLKRMFHVILLALSGKTVDNA